MYSELIQAIHTMHASSHLLTSPFYLFITKYIYFLVGEISTNNLINSLHIGHDITVSH